MQRKEMKYLSWYSLITLILSLTLSPLPSLSLSIWRVLYPLSFLLSSHFLGYSPPLALSPLSSLFLSLSPLTLSLYGVYHLSYPSRIFFMLSLLLSSHSFGYSISPSFSTFPPFNFVSLISSLSLSFSPTWIISIPSFIYIMLFFALSSNSLGYSLPLSLASFSPLSLFLLPPLFSLSMTSILSSFSHLHLASAPPIFSWLFALFLSHFLLSPFYSSSLLHSLSLTCKLFSSLASLFISSHVPSFSFFPSSSSPSYLLIPLLFLSFFLFLTFPHDYLLSPRFILSCSTFSYLLVLLLCFFLSSYSLTLLLLIFSFSHSTSSYLLILVLYIFLSSHYLILFLLRPYFLSRVTSLLSHLLLTSH